MAMFYGGLRIWALFAVLLAVPGCGGSGPGNGNGNGNTNTNDNSNGNDNDNDNDNSGAGFSVRIVANPPVTSAEVGDEITLDVRTSGELPTPLYAWSVAPPGAAVLADPGGASTRLTFGLAGQVSITLVVTDVLSGASAQDVLNVTVTAAPELPPGAAIEVLPLPPARSGDFVTLIAEPEGVIPLTLAWAPDPLNIVDAGQLQFFDLGNGMATMTIPAIFSFTYELRFVVTATYDNGATLEEELTLLVN